MLKRVIGFLFIAALLTPPVFAQDDPGSVKAKRPPANAAQGDDQGELKTNKALGAPRPDFKLKDLTGKQFHASDWNGKVLVVNFWATWCPPCRHEMPMFVKMQEKYGTQGLQFVGIALDDEHMVRDFTDNFQVNYPILIGDPASLDLAKNYGNYLGALPFTAIVDRKGFVAHVRPGEMTQEEIEPVIKKLL